MCVWEGGREGGTRGFVIRISHSHFLIVLKYLHILKANSSLSLSIALVFTIFPTVIFVLTLKLHVLEFGTRVMLSILHLWVDGSMGLSINY